MRSTLALQRFGPADVDRLIGWIPDARMLMQWAGPGYTFPLDAAQLAANQRDTDAEPPRRHIFKAVRRDGTAVGHIELALPAERPDCGRLCRILVGPGWQGRGYGPSLVRLACGFGFDELGLTELDLLVFDFNEAAIRTYERVGFVATGKTVTCQLGDEHWRGLRMRLDRQRWQG